MRQPSLASVPMRRIPRAAVRTALLGPLLLFVLTLGAHASGVAWGDFDEATHALLTPWHDGWDTTSIDDRQRLLANAMRWQAMSAADRAAFLRRSAAWDALPLSQRTQRREHYSAWRTLGPVEQARVRAAALRFAALPMREQQRLRALFSTLDADSQRAWLQGPTSGGWIASVLPLFAYLPDGERASTLAMLRSLPQDARTPLLQLAQRLPEQQREMLRRDLLRAAQADRVRLLQQRLAQ